MPSRTPTLLAVVPCLLVSACGIPGPHTPVPPGMDREEYAALELFASRNLNCDPERLTYESFGNGRHLFKGCDDSMEMLLLKGGDARGYARGFIVPSPSNVYAKERKCDLRSTVVDRVDPQTRIVDGCGARTTYLLACGRTACSWVANTETKR